MDHVERLNKRNEIAKHLVTSTYKEMIPELERQAKEAYELELKEWKLKLDEIGQAENVPL